MKERAKDAIAPMKAPPVNEIPISAIWLRSKHEHGIEVLVEVGGKWYRIINDLYAGECSISHMVNANGIQHATEYESPE